MAAAFVELAAVLSIRQATRLLGVSRATHYRKGRPAAAQAATGAGEQAVRRGEGARVVGAALTAFR
jgi:hypothetical protein